MECLLQGLCHVLKNQLVLITEMKYQEIRMLTYCPLTK